MNATFHIDYLAEHHLAVGRPVGLLTEERADEMLSQMRALEVRIPEPFNRFFDLTGVTDFPLQSAVIHRYTALRRETSEALLPCRTAILVPNSAAEIVARIYQGLMDGSKISVEVFDNVEAASEWLGVPVTVLEPQPADHR